ncbi:ORF020 dsRNA-binding PKR inhibitor [Bovine papular stomatitis virus]|uniref:ORF020 dsRNA-binding PKR inhibitor n=1 Tax=Bovine papular stomatitis virus TaxID=129727 RepID=Q6TVG8_9POXV|nr:ORF020 dsRNA-binding PKR inhibitor [Bovine papular stomatitis virus]AAR98377.1 ORF020 dsRNA-binding PKR inhibitor [Bovine papular stomatitis virus]
MASCDRESKILTFLSSSGTPVPAKRVAAALGISKHDANRCLYKLLESDAVSCVDGCPPLWSAPCEADEKKDTASGDDEATGGSGSDPEPMETECTYLGASLFGEDIDVLTVGAVTHLKTLNPVSAVNEYCMRVHRPLVFQECRTGGHDHCPLFTCTVVVSNKTVSTASGCSKKAARNAACTDALTILINNCGVSF